MLDRPGKGIFSVAEMLIAAVSDASSACSLATFVESFVARNFSYLLLPASEASLLGRISPEVLPTRRRANWLLLSFLTSGRTYAE